MHHMREGAFALIDCLGFKGIWKRSDISTLLLKFQQIGSRIEEEITLKIQEYEHLKKPVSLDVTLLSDSIAISLRYQDCKSRSAGYKSYLIWLICSSALKVLDLYFESEPHLVLRGCITYGQYESYGNFIVGPAVDTAADNMGMSQGAFVWLLPPAADLYRRCKATLNGFLKTSTLEEWARRTMLSEWASNAEVKDLAMDIEMFLNEPVVIDSYDMPLKTQEHLRCAVLNPLAHHRTAKARRKVIQGYSEAMSGNQIDVLLKHQYTMEFLSVADKICADNASETFH